MRGSHALDSPRLRRPERAVGSEDDDEIIGGWLSRRVRHRSRKLRWPVGEREDDAANVLSRPDVNRRVERIPPVDDGGLERPSRRVRHCARHSRRDAVASRRDTGDRERSAGVDRAGRRPERDLARHRAEVHAELRRIGRRRGIRCLELDPSGDCQAWLQLEQHVRDVVAPCRASATLVPDCSTRDRRGTRPSRPPTPPQSRRERHDVLTR